MSTAVVWLRRDLRLHDNVALYEACREHESVCLAFVLDPPLLRGDQVGAPIVQAFFGGLAGVRASLKRRGSDLALLEGDFSEELLGLARRIGAAALYYNEDYEPNAIRRDEFVSQALRAQGIVTDASQDHVYFGAREIEQHSGAPYKVFTPYRKRWLDQRHLGPRAPVPSAQALEGKAIPAERIGTSREVPKAEDYGHTSSPAYPLVNESQARALLVSFLEPGGAIERYKEHRNIPSIAGTSILSPHLRAGTIGIRECVERAFARVTSEDAAVRTNIETWVSELVWRDFYQMVLRRFPHVATGAFLEAGNRVAWRTSENDFRAWCDGRTGYPIVDAAMRQLNTTGWMHNRLRMIVASFLTKDLLIDWRRGERYFEQHLADADLAANNGGWQWAASTGTDAAPYFRIFNPARQSKTFDPSGEFIRAIVAELRDVPDAYVHEPWTMPPLVQAQARCTIGKDYPAPIVDHATARANALAMIGPHFRTGVR